MTDLLQHNLFNLRASARIPVIGHQSIPLDKIPERSAQENIQLRHPVKEMPGTFTHHPLEGDDYVLGADGLNIRQTVAVFGAMNMNDIRFFQRHHFSPIRIIRRIDDMVPFPIRYQIILDVFPLQDRQLSDLVRH